MHKIVLIFLFFAVSPALAQTEITWQTLADVRFTDKYSEAEEAYYYYPYFGESVQELNGQDISITGYMLVLGIDKDIFILSQNAYSECFFCGKGGPESIIELRMKPGHKKFKMDQVVKIKGRLRLNRDNIYECNYIIEEAEVVE